MTEGTGGKLLYTAFGSAWSSDTPLTQFDEVDREDIADPIQVRATDATTERTPIRTINRGHIYADGLSMQWHDEARFDLFDGMRIDYRPGPDWRGAMPAAFYSTVTALTLAWRGDLPFHASAVELDGRAILIAGAPGAGKSTLTAALLDRGAALVADDLTVIDRPSTDSPGMVCRGRRTIRLHRDTADRLAAADRHPAPGDNRDKWLARPFARTEMLRMPLAGFILLGPADGPIPQRAGAMLLGRHLFRPRWLSALPGHAARLGAVMAIGARVPVQRLYPGAGFHADPRRVDAAFRIIETMTRS